MPREMHSDTLELDISFAVLVRRPALFSRETFDVPSGMPNGHEKGYIGKKHFFKIEK